MLHEFLKVNRRELIDRCRTKAAHRDVPGAIDAAVEHGIPSFLDQLIRTLELEQISASTESCRISGRSGGGEPFSSEIGETAAMHGLELSQRAFSIGHVVHAYGDLCQATTDLAYERDVAVQVGEFRTLNRCLDNAIAGAVTEYLNQRDTLSAGLAAVENHERLGCLAHELRDLIHTATLALSAIRTGNVGLSGATGMVLDRSLTGLRKLVDRTLAEAHVTSGLLERRSVFPLSDLLAEVSVSAALEAQARDCELAIMPIDPTLAVDADRDQLSSALGNLLQNAIKFTESHTKVSVTAYASGERVRIDVEDHCGGFPAADNDQIFVPFTQYGADKSGLGLGLSICRRNLKANGGVLEARNLPGTGCVFTIDLPRHELTIQTA